MENVKNVVKKMRGNLKSTLDDKGRMSVPAKFRDTLRGDLVIARHVDKDRDVICLKIYTEDAWEKFDEKLSNIPQAETAKVIRSIDSQDVEMDKQYRILIPQSLRNYAKLEGELIVIGGGYTAEIWNKEEFDRLDTDNMEDTADILEKHGI